MRTLSTRFTLIALALSLVMTAWAKPKSENVKLYHNATVNGTLLPAGDYVVKYESEGSTTQVHFIKGGKEVCAASAELKTLTTKSADNSVLFADDANPHRISEIDFGRKNTAVTFESASTGAGK